MEQQETKTIKNMAESLGVTPAAVKRTLTRWTDHPEKKSLFTAGQKSFVKNIKAETEWPEWLVTVWCDNYQPRASNGGASKVVNLPIRKVPTVAVKMMEEKTAKVFAGVGDYPADDHEPTPGNSTSVLSVYEDALKEKDLELAAIAGELEYRISKNDGLLLKIEQQAIELQELSGDRLELNIKVDDLLIKINQASERISQLEDKNEALKNSIDLERATVDVLNSKLLAYEADTWHNRMTGAVQYAFSDYLIPKVALLAFQSYIYAIYVMRVFAFLNTKIASRPDIAETYRDNVLHHPWFYGMWVIGFFVDGAGFAIAAKLSEPKYLSDGDARLTWIGWFFVLQILIDLCYLFGTFEQYVEWFGAVIVVVAPALAIMAYARSSFKKGQA